MKLENLVSWNEKCMYTKYLLSNIAEPILIEEEGKLIAIE